MTMPYGAVEEPEVQYTEPESVAVHVVSSVARPGKNLAAEFGGWRTYLIANVVNSQVSTPGAERICNRSLRRKRVYIRVVSGGNVTPSVAGFPSIATSGTAIQNPFNYPVNVTLAGFTATQVFVNGILVGAGNGTYLVPAGGSLSVTFTVLGTTTAAGIPQAQSSLDGVILGSREFIQNSQQVVSPYIAGIGAGFLPINVDVTWESQQELWAAFPPSNGGPVLVIVGDQVYASDPDAWKGEQ